jgi:hypothetical protein
VLAIGPFRNWLTEHMTTDQLTSADVARLIGRDDAMVRGWFGVRGRDWRTQSPNRFVHIISELTIEHVGIALTGNPRLVPELYPHMAEPVCQRCGGTTDCDHLGHEAGRSPPDTLDRCGPRRIVVTTPDEAAGCTSEDTHPAPGRRLPPRNVPD